MGPSGCGKSTLLRAVNLMYNLYPNIQTEKLGGNLVVVTEKLGGNLVV